MANDQEVKYLVPGLERGLQLLLAFGEQHRELTFAELHRLVDMPKATAYRVVQTLEYMGFLERNARTNTFSLGMNVLRLGFEYIASLDVAQVGQPVIEQLRDVSQCSSHLAIRDGRDIIYIARVSAAGSRINQVSIGTAPILNSCSRTSGCRATRRGSFTTAKPCGRWCSRTKPADM